MGNTGGEAEARGLRRLHEALNIGGGGRPDTGGGTTSTGNTGGGTEARGLRRLQKALNISGRTTSMGNIGGGGETRALARARCERYFEELWPKGTVWCGARDPRTRRRCSFLSVSPSVCNMSATQAGCPTR